MCRLLRKNSLEGFCNYVEVCSTPAVFTVNEVNVSKIHLFQLQPKQQKLRICHKLLQANPQKPI